MHIKLLRSKHHHIISSDYHIITSHPSHHHIITSSHHHITKSSNHQIIPIILSLFFALCSYESEVETVIINSQFYSTHFGVVVLRASSAPRLRFAYRRLCTFNYPKPLKGLLITIVSYSFSHHPANHSLSPFRG